MLRVTRAPKIDSRRRILNLFAAVAVACGLVGLGVGMSAPASAATRVFGYDTAGTGGGFLGAVRGPDGMLAYCIDPVGLFPSGTTDAGTNVSSISARTAANSGGHGGTAAVSGADIQKLNYSLAKFGESADSDNAAAAEAVYVYSITADYPYPTTDAQANVTYYIDSRVPKADRAAVQAGYAAIAAEVDAHYASAAPAASTTTILMSPHPSLSGTVTVTVSPADSTGTLVLAGAVVAGTTDATVPVHNRQVIPITATALTGPHLYDITATSTFTVPTVPLPEVHLYNTGSPAYAQRDISVGGYTNGTVESSAVDVDPMSGQFEPIVTTQVAAAFVSKDQSLRDTLLAGVDPNTTQPWGAATGGSPDPVVARGLLYCGLGSAPKPGESPPQNATVVGPELVTLTGPGSYTTGDSARCPVAGYAAWQWSIVAADQSTSTLTDLPIGYAWSDTFGAAEETAYVRNSIELTSQVDAQLVGLGQPITDTITIVLPVGQEWPTDRNDEPARATVYGTAYWIAGDAQPSVSAAPPDGAPILATAQITATHPGDYSAPSVDAPSETDGYVVWEWAIPHSDYFEAWTEAFAEPSQIAKVDSPTLSSVAQASAIVGHNGSDSVQVSGPTMGFVANVSWAVYFVPPGGPTKCDVSNRVFDSASEPVRVTKDGTYRPLALPTFPSPGSYFWVASLTSPNGTLLARGSCGDPTEVTQVTNGLALTGVSNFVEGLLTATSLGTIGALFAVSSLINRGRRRMTSARQDVIS